MINANTTLRRHKFPLIIVMIFMLAAISGCGQRTPVASVQNNLPALNNTNENHMQITSSEFNDNQSIPARFTCDGEDVNPPLLWNRTPDGTKSLVLIVDDPDAPAGDWVHWTVWNIDPAATAINENSVPDGAIQGMTDFGKPGYGGPCPPSGTHHYHFRLYALDTKLGLDPSARKTDLEQAMSGHILGEAMLTGLYAKQQ